MDPQAGTGVRVSPDMLLDKVKRQALIIVELELMNDALLARIAALEPSDTMEPTPLDP